MTDCSDDHYELCSARLGDGTNGYPELQRLNGRSRTARAQATWPSLLVLLLFVHASPRRLVVPILWLLLSISLQEGVRKGSKEQEVLRRGASSLSAAAKKFSSVGEDGYLFCASVTTRSPFFDASCASAQRCFPTVPASELQQCEESSERAQHDRPYLYCWALTLLVDG